MTPTERAAFARGVRLGLEAAAQDMDAMARAQEEWAMGHIALAGSDPEMWEAEQRRRDDFAQSAARFRAIDPATIKDGDDNG